jgi:hypothetical protein
MKFVHICDMKREFDEKLKEEINKIENADFNPGDGCLYKGTIVHIKYAVADCENLRFCALILWEFRKTG